MNAGSLRNPASYGPLRRRVQLPDSEESGDYVAVELSCDSTRQLLRLFRCESELFLRARFGRRGHRLGVCASGFRPFRSVIENLSGNLCEKIVV